MLQILVFCVIVWCLWFGGKAEEPPHRKRRGSAGTAVRRIQSATKLSLKRLPGQYSFKALRASSLGMTSRRMKGGGGGGEGSESDAARAAPSRRVLEASDEEFPSLQKLDLYAAEIEGDGNCLFRAMSDQLYGEPSRHRQVRREVVEYMRENSELFKTFLGDYYGETWTAYLRRMARDGVYGDNPEIVAFARRFRARVYIYLKDRRYVVASDDDPEREVHLAYHEWEHYSSVRNKGGPHMGVPEVCPSIVGIPTNSKPDSIAPEWKVKIIRKGIPAHVILSDYEIVTLLKRNNGDIGRTIEKVVLDDMEGRLPIEPITPAPAEEPKKKQKPGPKPRLTAREKKERQKRDALERKRAKHSRAPSQPTGESGRINDHVETMNI
ncbi:hypothetical protein TRVA0_016S01728 [Trichomonascus vanleenenianus]|uniref:OTU domain-containing protein n=1 Tax=Trichomonascus vanleenenianus TaxID=2268995 RepID=UPI003ECAEBA5